MIENVSLFFVLLNDWIFIYICAGVRFWSNVLILKSSYDYFSIISFLNFVLYFRLLARKDFLLWNCIFRTVVRFDGAFSSVPTKYSGRDTIATMAYSFLFRLFFKKFQKIEKMRPKGVFFQFLVKILIFWNFFKS